MAGMVEKVEKMGTQKGYAETRTPNQVCHPLSGARAPQHTSYTIRPYKRTRFVNPEWCNLGGGIRENVRVSDIAPAPAPKKGEGETSRVEEGGKVWT